MADISIQKFEFTKNWNNPTDFLTYQPDEAQVRADQQELHDQTRDFINDVLLGAVMKVITENQEYVERTVADAIMGVVPDKSIGIEKLACATLELLENDAEKLPTSFAVAKYIKGMIDAVISDEATGIPSSAAVIKYVEQELTALTADEIRAICK